MHHTQRGRQVLIIRRLTRHWLGAALALLLVMATSGHGQSDPNAIVKTTISIDYNGNVVRTYWNRAGGAARTETLGNIHQPGGYHGPVPPGYYSPGSYVRGEHTKPPQLPRVAPPPRTNPPRQPVLPRRVVAPRQPTVRSTIKIVTYWRRQVRSRNGGWDWERNPNGTLRTVKMVGYNVTLSDGTSRYSGVQGKGDPNMTSQGYRMVGYDVSSY